MKSFRDIRVIPVVLVAIAGLAVLKIAGLFVDGGYVFNYQPQSTKRSWAQEMLNFPARKREANDITGSVQEKPKEESASPAPAPETSRPDGTLVYPDQTPQVSASERAILERLQSRRQELEARAREIDIRESLLKAAGKRIEARGEDVKPNDSRASMMNAQKTEAEAARFKGIITMYESMKPKDAAKVFDRLEMPVLYEIASQIAPRKMSATLGLMQPEAAERLTVELPRRAGSDKALTAEL